MHDSFRSSQQGFTLLEVIMVLVIIALAANTVIGNFFVESEEQKLEKQAQRFQVIVDMASDYAVLNQQQLGVRIEKDKNQYLFMHLDEEDKWQLIAEDKLFAEHNLPENFFIDFELDDLPWVEEDSLFDAGIFDEELSFSEDDIQIGEEEEKPLPPPQILILSSGDITPFSVSFAYEPDFGDDEPVYFRVNAEDLPPLKREGPLESL